MTPPVATSPAPATIAQPPARRTGSTLLADRLDHALAAGEQALSALAEDVPVDRRDRFRSLLTIYDLHTAPLEQVGDAVRHQGSPAVAALKRRLEGEWLAELEDAWAGYLAEGEAPIRPDGDVVDDVVAAMRAIAARDRLPAAYRWLAKEARWDDVVEFLTLEGGPDGGFDDLVALCQVGLAGSAKLELGKNYWDEMGCGNADGVHTVLYQRMAAAIGMPHVPRADQPVAALERSALGGLLATNRWLQPEMVGALGLIELQAGPRCRLVLQAFDRLGAPEDAYPFYVEHAEVDPVHGKDWMDKAIVPLVAERPAWAERIVKGAWWRSAVNLQFFTALHRSLVAAA